jgi:hypothetical protein|tara:strand:+ start:1479 stop:2123 length:645 start_codon:yes stop_codon:yes gene_type:complete
MNEQQIEASVLAPFGPRILKAKVPSDMLDTLNAHCDEILEIEGREELSLSKDLVGHVREEWACDLEKAPDFGNMLFILTKGLYDHFINERKEKQTAIPENLVVHKSWFVRAFENDYNPAHMHTSGSYSCVLYLKVPENISDTNHKHVDKQVTEGYLDFIYGTSLVCCAGNLCLKPEVGDLYIFPAYLFHAAYPFYGEGERRSFSANMSLGVKKE